MGRLVKVSDHLPSLRGPCPRALPSPPAAAGTPTARSVGPQADMCTGRAGGRGRGARAAEPTRQAPEPTRIQRPTTEAGFAGRAEHSTTGVTRGLPGPRALTSSATRRAYTRGQTALPQGADLHGRQEPGSREKQVCSFHTQVQRYPQLSGCPGTCLHTYKTVGARRPSCPGPCWPRGALLPPQAAVHGSSSPPALHGQCAPKPLSSASQGAQSLFRHHEEHKFVTSLCQSH